MVHVTVAHCRNSLRRLGANLRDLSRSNLMTSPLELRISRLEALEAIRDLAGRYALALDSKDIDTVVTLFVDDGRPVFFRYPGDAGTAGGQALWDSYQITQRRYSNSQHFICQHVIDIDDAFHARGIVYAYIEQEFEAEWTLLAEQYWDHYECIAGRWLFAARRSMAWYQTTWNEAPVGPNKMRHPGRLRSDAALPKSWPTWTTFWNRPQDQSMRVAKSE